MREEALVNVRHELDSVELHRSQLQKTTEVYISNVAVADANRYWHTALKRQWNQRPHDRLIGA
jgi:hypothetical protein